MNRYLPVLIASLCAACVPRTREPANLSDLKAEVTEYADSGHYDKDLASSVSTAKTYLTVRAANGGENLTVIFDIDETVLSNLPHMKEADWGYQPENWDKWVAKADAPALPPVRDVYHHAISLGMKVVFLTGRTETDRAATVRNLRQQGMAIYEKLILRPKKGSAPYLDAVVFKTNVRKELTEQGYTIVASFGDQESDVKGGYVERGFKLPNPFYKIK